MLNRLLANTFSKDPPPADLVAALGSSAKKYRAYWFNFLVLQDFDIDVRLADVRIG